MNQRTKMALCALLLWSACGNDKGPEGQWPLSKRELESRTGAPEPGESTYRRYCISCHGADGRGNGGVTGADFVSGRESIAAKTDAELAEAVREGRRGARAVMPAHKAVLSDAQIADAVAYVRKRFLLNPAANP